MRVVVTGAGGYVGGRLVARLRADGVDVVPTLRTPKPWVPDAVVADLLHDDLGPLMGGADAVVHLAGASEVVFGREPDRAHAETIAATVRVAEATAAAGAHRLVYLSTFHVYGGRTDGGVVHEDVVPEPVHPYAASRLEGEGLAAGLGPEHVVVLRLTNSLGPPIDARVDRWTLVANELCRRVVAGEDLHPRDGGRALRDFVDLGEACRVIALAAGGSLPGDTYNLGSGVTRSILDLADLIADASEEVLGRRPAVEPEPAEGDAPEAFRVDVGRLASWVPAPDPDLRPALVETIRLLA